jgi:hypothetical protein
MKKSGAIKRKYCVPFLMDLYVRLQSWKATAAHPRAPASMSSQENFRNAFTKKSSELLSRRQRVHSITLDGAMNIRTLASTPTLTTTTPR